MTAHKHIGAAALVVCGAIPAMAQTAPAPAPPPTAWKLGPVDVSGMVDAYYSLGFNHPAGHVSLLRAFDDKANQVELNMASITLDYGPKPIGFHLDAGVGRVFDIMNAVEKDATGMRFFKQAYFSVKPSSWKGVEVDFGRFVTFASAELIETPNNWNYSRSLLFFWCTPSYHFGMQVKAPIGAHFNAGAQWVAGWNNIITGATYRTVGLTGAWTTPKATWTNNYYGGPDENKADRGMRNLWDSILVLNPNPKTSVYLNFDYLHNSPKFTPAYRIYGVAGAARFQLTSKLALSSRLEWMNDESGRVTGAPQRVKEFTLTGTYAFLDRLSGWLEFRNDWSNQPFFNRGNQLGNWKTQPTLLVGMVALIRPAGRQ
jgi:Putative beta-barrel porin-2, OmpL-like. bbp2